MGWPRAWLGWLGQLVWLVLRQPVAARGIGLEPYNHFCCLAWLLGWTEARACKLRSAKLREPTQSAQTGWPGLAGFGVRLDSHTLDAQERSTIFPIEAVC